MKVISLLGPKSAQAGVEATFGRTFDGDKGRTATVADGQERTPKLYAKSPRKQTFASRLTTTD